jgi:O-antigen/teichoic acid export membrane protein
MNWPSLIRNMASVTVLRIGLSALGFGLFWLLSHRLPAEQLGRFSVLMNTFFLLQALPLLGLQAPLIRTVAAQPEALAEQVSNALVFALPVAALIAAGLGAYGVSWAEPGLMVPFLLLGLSILPTAWTLVAESALIGRESMHEVARVNLLEALGRLCGAWWAVSQGWGLGGVFLFFLLGRMASAIAYVFSPRLARPSLGLVRGAVQRKYLAEVPTYLGLTLVLAVVSRADVIVVSRLLGLREAGVYAAAGRLYEASLMLSTIAALVAFPILSRLFVTDRTAFLAMLDRCLRWGLLLGGPLTLLGMALAPWLVHKVYAQALWAAAPVLQLLLIAAWLTALDQLLSSTMMAAQAQRQDLMIMSLGLLAMLLMLAGFSPVWGLQGAAAAIVAALALRVGLRLWWAQRSLPLPGLLRSALRAAMASAAGLIAFWSLEGVQALLAGGLAHLLIALLTGTWSAQYRADWQGLSRRLRGPSQSERQA